MLNHKAEIAKIQDVIDTLVLTYTKIKELDGDHSERLKIIDDLISRYTGDQIAIQDDYKRRR